MTVVALVIGSVFIVGIVAVFLATRRPEVRPPTLIESRVRRRVVVTLKSGEAFDGLLYDSDDRCLILREARALSFGPRSEHVVVEGEAVLLTADVHYIQLP